jgi:hypothetical protein
MKQETKLTTHQQAEQASEMRAAQTAGQEFSNVEDQLRHDAGQTVVPPNIAQRLSQSVNDGKAPRRPWWRRLFD